MASRIFVSNFLAIISAAFPLGLRMIGTCPGETLDAWGAKGKRHVLMVATTLNKPFATRSISSSICCSAEVGELRMAYVECVCEGPGCAGAFGVEAEGAAGGGNRENKDGEGAMKDKY